MPRYVILEHDHPTCHWDFLLEVGTMLRSWRLTAPPSPETPVAAEASFDHRLIYLDYEGPISGGRGSVIRWDAGIYSGSLEETCVEVTVQGSRLLGNIRMSVDNAGGWWLLFEPTAES
jgi:DNA polymerase Ligase (LigD)